VSHRSDFEERVLPHLDAAYNLARWLLRDERAADDAVQEAALRAFRHFDGLRGDNAKPWLLGIVRNTCFTMLERRRDSPEDPGFDNDALDALRGADEHAGSDPAQAESRRRDRLRIDAAIRTLPPPLREVIVLRELEELEYAEIARIAAVPIGTVMSRLSRAREKLRNMLQGIDAGG
jgi:RNA polymerase sigma-70 factor (ECF subfamily)